MNLLVLYIEFFKIGLFSVGGGLATLPFLFQLSDVYHWMTAEDIGNFLAIAQSSPGAIGVNMAAQTGFACAGIPGALIAPLGLISPAIICIVIIARMLTAFKESKIVAAVFQGLRPAAAGLLAFAGFGVWKLVLWDNGAGKKPQSVLSFIRWKEAAIFIILFVLIKKTKLHPVIFIALGGAAGIVLGL
ncbi:MAG: chromate transporter [Treponema sp.]|jgi:chromate transporter|nr:chromate transporter [Treponema sp.]